MAKEKMFEDLREAMNWAQKHYPGCSLRVKEQADGPTIVSIKGQNDELRKVVYLKKKAGE